MFISTTGRSRGNTVVAMAMAGLMFSVPVKADTPKSLPQLDQAIQTPQALPIPPAAVTPAVPAPVLPSAVPAAPLEAAPAIEPGYEFLGEGEASYYGSELAGNRTASGERFNPRELTAAHRTLPLGSKIRVTNKSNGKSVIVRVNDRGPFVKRRIVDVSRAAAEEIAMVRSGKAHVTLEVLR